MSWAAAVCGAGMFSGAGAQTSPAAATAAPQAEADKRPEVVEVTASKRRERALDVPISLSTIPTERLENLGVTRFADYASLVPNLTQVSSQGAGSGTVVMRGFYTGPQQTTNTTATYLGDTPISSSGALAVGAFFTPDVDLFDIARVEVLKGPQGTLYGASALGGLLRLVPRLPDTQYFSGSVRLGLSTVQDGSNGHSAKLGLNVPLAKGVAAMQVSAFSRKEGGFITNVGTGEKDLGEVNAKGGAVTLLVTPTKGLQLTLRTIKQEADTYGPPYQETFSGSLTPVYGERKFSALFTPSVRSELDLTEGGLEYTTAIGTVTASFGRAESNLFQAFDAKPTGLAFGAAGARQQPNVALAKDTLELRFASRRFGGFEALGGIFRTKENSTYNVSVNALNADGTVAAPPLDLLIRSIPEGTYEETAVFGNLTYYVSDAIDISAGLRRAKNQQDYTITRTGLLVTIGASVPLTVVKSEDTSTTWQLTTRYRPTQDMSWFARVATGYRPGGPQTNPRAPQDPFLPDTVRNLEVGMKALALNRRLAFDWSVYKIDWSKVQLNGLLNNFVVVGNAGKAEIKGFEAQLSWGDRSGLRIGGSLGYNDAKLTEIGSGTAISLGAAPGDRLPQSPKFTAAAFGDYEFGLAGLQASAGATVRHRGSFNSAYSLGTANVNVRVPEATTIDLRAQLRWSQYALRFGIDNLLDDNHVASYVNNRSSAAQTTVYSQATLIRPRTYSVSLSAEF